VRLVGTAENLADPLGELLSAEQPLWLYDLPLAADPFGLYCVEPEALLGKQTGHYPHPSFATALFNSRPGRPAETVVVISNAGPKEVARLRKSIYGLSPREQEIADLVVRGLSTRQISKTLYISEYTVQDHLKNVFGKVGVKGRRELVKRLFLDNLPPQISA
jgi:DNA-binding CsgD family transcriptional regulator